MREGSNAKQSENDWDTIPGDPNELAEPPKWAAVSEARKEEQGWDSLDKKRLENDLNWLEQYGRMVIIFSWAFAVIFLASFCIWAWHYIGPSEAWGIRLHWVDQDKLSKIQSLLFSGGMGAVVSGTIRAQLGKAQ